MSKTKNGELMNEIAVAHKLNRTLNEIFEEKHSNEPLECYYKFFDSLKVILTAIEFNEKKIGFPISLLFQTKGIKNKIYEYEKKASKEIDSLIFTNNNNSKNFIQTIQKECGDIENRFKEIENNNKLISGYIKNKDEFISKLFEMFTPSEQLVFDGYFSIRTLFSEFYSKFNSKVGEVDIKETSHLIKIKWDGQKNQLYDVIRQLKEEKKLIVSSYTDLAVFLKHNFETFENTQLNTILTELQRGKRPPKSRRVDIDISDKD